ncbi:unnamed protein product [Parnassius mnemosyne]|uniref:Calpain catalytic domain-containing protein n=1 Tax=Parnassius mnemosyne TaxID=213953 RepID=A0AAV1KWK4_9NEOP
MRKFVRTRPAAPPADTSSNHPPHSPNGHLNGIGSGPRRDDHHSTLSSSAVHHAPTSRLRYWNGEEAAGALWEDPDFPANASAIGDRRLAANVQWLRPYELSAQPRFLGDTIVEAKPPGETQPLDPNASETELEDEPEEQFAARWCVEVGELGDAGLCCAAAALALTPRLLARVAPPHSFRRGYTGAFRFQVWVFGSWREVVVDDRLPARGARLLASRSALPHDYTLPLLEKAYAKLYGSYAALRGGSCARALQDMTGGVVQSFAPPRQPPALLLRVLNTAVPRSTLLVATAKPEKEGSGQRMRNGLIAEQAYCVTGLARVREAGGGAGGEEEGGGVLVRVRAPSGRGEWRGAGARGGPLWRALPPADRDLLAARTPEPAHFWMPFAEFARAFWRLELVHVGPDEWVREAALRARRPWRLVVARRRWRAGYNAGGPPPGRTAAANPQFRVAVPPPAAAHLVLAVAQRYEPAAPRPLRGVGFALFELPPAAVARRAALATDEDAFKHYRPLETAHAGRAREVAAFVLLAPGHYLLVPHARRAHAEGAFLLRVLCDRRADVWEVNDDNVIIRDINTEFQDDGRSIPPHVEAAISKVIRKQGSDELDAWALRAVLRGGGAWGGAWGGACGGASLELCRALVALRDGALAGRLAARELAPLLALLALWRAAVRRHARRSRVSAYRLRALLWAAGVGASNKVLECLVLRFASRTSLSADACLLALARLHLAHERYRTLDAKLKSNPLSLEEVILMTIYS